MQVVLPSDRDKFLDICLRQRTLCDGEKFKGPRPTFRWESAGVSESAKLLHDCFETHCTFSTVERVIRHKHIRDKYWSSLACIKFGGACPEEETSAVQEVSPGKGESVVLAGNDEYAAQPINRALEALYTSWSSWTTCSVSCGMDGTRVRTRSCSPQTTPMPPCEGEVRQIQFCNVYVCPVHGSWAEWGEWSRCSTLPISPDGFILRRYRQCRSVFDDEHEEGKNDEEDGDSSGDKSADGDQQCQLVVSVKLKMARVLLDVEARGATLNIASNVTLLLGAWHEVLVEVLKSGASLRINDQKRLHASFSQSLDRDLDFDSYMVIGAVENKTLGFEGSICTLSINFRPQDLFASADWEGQGTPVGRHGVSAENINPSVQLPHFRGLYYASLRLPYKSGLDVRLTLWLDEGDGLILYTRGVGPGSHFSLGMRGSRLIVCLRCTTAVKTSCHHAEVLKLRQWYQVALTVNQLQAEVRIDQSQASQLTCRGNSFTPEETLFIGGRGIPGWGSVQKATNYTKGTDSEDTDFDLYLPTRRGLHTEDSKTEAQQYLASEESQLQKIRVRSFGPPDPRILTITPGTSSRRVVVPADGTMKIGEDRRQNTSASYVPVARVPSTGVDDSLTSGGHGVDQTVDSGHVDVVPDLPQCLL
nr:hypothetical protein BaRGS_000428 [Batillaria attramentaria]